MRLRNITEAEAALLPYVPLVAQLTGKDTTLERILPLMELLGNPQQRIRVVHIAGTSGKTSTAYYMAALLRASGHKVGLTVSPHVDAITERVQIDGSPLAGVLFCEELGRFLELIKPLQQPPSYFELLYAFALWVFERQAVDYAVVETGLGGLFDATNVVTRADKVCVITDIGFDHMQVLGHTLAEIAAQKIGIVHPGNMTFTYRQAAEILQVFKAWTSQKKATLRVLEPADVFIPDNTDIQQLPLYQQRNWLLAYQVYLYLAERDELQHLTSKELRLTQSVFIPGRMDIRHVGGKTIVMDGAHNGQKMTAFVTSFQLLYPGVKPAILIALKEGKEYQEVEAILAPLASQVIVTTFETSQDLPVRSMDPAKLAAAFTKNGALAVQCIADQQLAYRTLLSQAEPVCVITGSFYLLSQIRRLGA